jgi:hypothetical protein
MSEGSNEKSKCTSLTTAISDCSARSMRVECRPSFRVSKKVSESPAWFSSQGSAAMCVRLKCSQAKPRRDASGSASHVAAWPEATGSPGASGRKR